ncbi:uncharacterized protein LOC122951080 [Acropora millepora]|uniref:uncharacterized protein LOC122951080 n=1 Tax=Acropora millepora TaxID=45264 RepID=UPI001CF2F5A0|nr:uncharacterized protein LOC122951080 [Acropora millepora]
MYFVGRARGYGVYGIIRDLIEEGSAKFVNNSGRYLVNWVKALEYYEAYKRKKNPDFNSRDQSRQKLSNSLRSALLSNSYKKDGAKEYVKSRKRNNDDEVVERQFQTPHKVFKSLFGNAEPSDSSEEQDEQGAVGAQAFAGSSSDTGFEEAMDLTFESSESIDLASTGSFLTNLSLFDSANVESGGPSTPFLYYCDSETQISEQVTGPEEICSSFQVMPNKGPHKMVEALTHPIWWRDDFGNMVKPTSPQNVYN